MGEAFFQENTPSQKAPATTTAQAQEFDHRVVSDYNKIKHTNYTSSQEVAKAVKDNPTENAGALAVAIKLNQDKFKKEYGMSDQQVNDLARTMLVSWGISQVLMDLIMKAVSSGTLSKNDISFLTQQFFQDKAVDTGKENADKLKKDFENKPEGIARPIIAFCRAISAVVSQRRRSFHKPSFC